MNCKPAWFKFMASECFWACPFRRDTVDHQLPFHHPKTNIQNFEFKVMNEPIPGVGFCKIKRWNILNKTKFNKKDTNPNLVFVTKNYITSKHLIISIHQTPAPKNIQNPSPKNPQVFGFHHGSFFPSNKFKLAPRLDPHTSRLKAFPLRSLHPNNRTSINKKWFFVIV